MAEPESREVLFECVRVGNSLRVTAFDVVTGTEATFQAPVTTSQTDLKRLAIRKLTYVLRKQRERQ